MKRRRALLLTLSVMLALCAACGLWLHRERQQYALNRQLIAALEDGDTRRALVLVNVGADPNTRQEPPPAPFLKRLPQLLRHIATANDSPTAFMFACGYHLHSLNGLSVLRGNWNENLPLLQSMLAHGADVYTRAISHRTALHFAVTFNREHTVEMLLKHGADVNTQDAEGRTPLMYAAKNDTTHMARLLLKHGAKPNAQDKDGYTALAYAAASQHTTSVIPELLAGGADPNLPNKRGRTPLQWAQQLRHLDIVRLLKQQGTK